MSISISDLIKELQAKKAATNAEIDAEIAKLESLGKAKEDLVKLVEKYKFANVTEFLTALDVIPAAETKKTKKTKAPKAPKTEGASAGFKRGKLGEDEKAKILELKNSGKTAAEISAELKRKESGIVKFLGEQK